ncbi:MAG: hypothetical protein ACXW5U_19625 [Thermoanaerobaculia bacterium]
MPPPVGLYLVSVGVVLIGLALLTRPLWFVRLFQNARPSGDARGLINRMNREIWSPDNTEAAVSRFRVIGVWAVVFGIAIGAMVFAARIGG